MGCNCASREQIEKLHAIYGEKVNPTTGTTAKFKVEKILTHAGVFVAMVFILPLLVGFIIYKGTTKEKKISIKKFLGIKNANKNIDSVIAENILKNVNANG
jgi:hypothetical protein